MDMEIISKFANFKKSILYENRFFNNDNPFLIELKKHIEQDLERKNPIMITILPKGSTLYRARIMDNDLDDGKNYVSKLMQVYQCELDMAKCCKKCDNFENDNINCIKSSEKIAEEFRHSAKEAFVNFKFSSEPNFNGFGKCDSSLPPHEKSNLVSDMRANPKYIRYLYAANDKYTALLEARSNINSLVSVANIEIVKPLRIFDITNSSQHIINDSELSMLFYELNNEFSTPVLGELKDYLTSQVISEFIKSLDCTPKFDGICFNSSLNPKGRNYTIFSEKNFQPVSSEVYYISEIGLTAYGVTEEQIVKIDSNSPNPSN